MNNDFADYELSKKLKDLGFSEGCICVVWPDNKTNIGNRAYVDIILRDFKEAIPSPSITQIRTWFREKHHLHYEVGPNWTGLISKLNESEFTEYNGVNIKHYNHVHLTDEHGNESMYPIHDAAELACIMKMIEMVEKKKRRK
jgi:hypothetical protein